MTFKELSIAMNAILSDHAPYDLNEELYLKINNNMNKTVEKLVNNYYEIQRN